MKLAITSDVHLEFGDLYLVNEQEADVLILSGDIFVACDLENWLHDESAQLIAATSVQKARADRYFNFIKNCLEEFKTVIYVMGNHEHYHGDYAKSAKIIRDTFAAFNNFHFFNNEWKIIDGVLFFGGTLWTNMNNEDPITMHQIRYMMNDFNCVKNTCHTDDRHSRVFMPEDAVEEHYDFRRKLDQVLESHPEVPVVVVGHHAPSKASTHPRYKNEFHMNGAYSTNLDDYILDRRQIKLWTHGHTHEDFDYMIGTTRVVCNPRGYDGHEERADNFQLKYVEI
jgi:Icc-related predicted phosphoesterase